MEVSRGVFALTRLLRVGGSKDNKPEHKESRPSALPGDDGVLNYVASSSGDLVVVFSRRSPRLLTLTLARRNKNKRAKNNNVSKSLSREQELVPDVRAVPWFEDKELRPRCVALAPSEDFAAIATAGGEIFVAPTKLLAPGFASKEKQDRDCNFRSWSDSSLTALPSKDLSHRLSHSLQHQQQQSPKEGSSSSSSNNKSSVEPTALLWWTTQDFGSVAYVGTSAGDLVGIDLTTGAEIGLVNVFPSGEAVSHLETVTDSALDCTHLIVTSSSSSKSSSSAQQVRILIDQRSTGVSWPAAGGSSALAIKGHRRTPSSSSSVATSIGEQATPRSRLSGLRQMSVAGLANLKHRINEGRRMLSSSSSSTGSTDRPNMRPPPSPSVEMGQDALEVGGCNGATLNAAGYEDPAIVGVEPLSPKVGATRVSVQQPSSSGDQPLLAGIFPDTAILTLHNSELEVLPQTAYKLPRGAEKVLLLDDKVMLVATSRRSDTSARCRQGQLHLVSALHAELHLDTSSKNDSSILQSFSLGPQESILALVKLRTILKDSSPSSSKKATPNPQSGDSAPEDPSNSQTSPSTSTDSQYTAVNAEDSKAGDDDTDEFSRKVEERSKEIRRLSHRSASRLECLVVTTEGVYLMEPSCDPAGTFLQLAMSGAPFDLESAGYISVAFALDARSLFELAADMKLCQREFAAAISLYRQSGAKHLRVVLKFASSGCISQLLSYLVVLFKTPNLEVTPADRIHLSNLALMAYFQQVLTKTTPTARSKFSAQIRTFLEENKHFDECLAVRLAAETREWGCLAHLTEIRGLACEMAEAVVAVAVGEGREDKDEGETGGAGEDVTQEVGRCLRDMSTTEREGLLGCLLHEGTVEAIVTASFSSPLAKKTALKHLKVLLATLPLLEEAGLASVLRQCGPTNSGLWSSYLQVLRGENLSNQQSSRQTRRGRERHEAGDDLDNAAKEESEVTDVQVARSLVNLTVSTALLLLKKRKTKVNTNTSSTSECKPVCDIIPRRYVVMSPRKSGEDDSAAPKVRRQLASAGAGHVLVVTKNGERLWAWGAAANGVLGRGATAARFCTPRKIDLFPQSCGVRVRAVACGKAHSLALTDAGLFAWGSSNFGQLGIGRLRRSEQRPAAVRSLMGEPIVSIAAGQYHSAAVDAAGGLWTWGWGVHGQLGNGDIEDAFEPVRICRKRKITQVSAGYAHTIALAEDGSLWSFGCGLWGQLGVGVTKKLTRPKRVMFPEGEEDKVKFVECGYFHNLAVTESGRVFTWGCNPQVLRLEAQQKKRFRLSQAGAKRITDAAAKRGLPLTPTGDEKPSLTAGSLLKDIKRQAKQALEDIRSYDGSGSKMVNSENVPPVMSNGTEEIEEKADEDAAAAAVAVDEEEEEVPAHLLPAEMDIRPLLAVPIKAVSCGNQHSLILTTDGGVFSVGRNMDGQLGIGSRKEARSPVSVQALADTNIVAISCGGDYSVALSDSGTAFAWGNNSSGQLGRAPVEESKDGTDSNTKVVVMKTTRRIIRLQNNIQNSCDVPRPVGGMRDVASHGGSSEVLADSEGVYHGREDFTSSSDEEQVAEWSKEAGVAMVKTREGFDALKDVADDDVEKLLHLTLELFAANILAEDREQCKKLSKQCIVADNLQAAAKITLLAGKLSQAFDFSLQLIIKRAATNGETSEVSEALFAAFLFYFKEAVKSDNKSQGDDEVQQVSQRLRRHLLERLISCWQDQGFSFVKLESLFLSSLTDEPQLLQTLVLNLFKPEDDEKEAEEDPVRASSPLSGGSAASSSGGPGPRLVDLFTPEFCLRIGDTCVREMGEEASKWMKLKKREEDAAE